jgi:hypothetical protein
VRASWRELAASSLSSVAACILVCIPLRHCHGLLPFLVWPAPSPGSLPFVYLRGRAAAVVFLLDSALRWPPSHFFCVINKTLSKSRNESSAHACSLALHCLMGSSHIREDEYLIHALDVEVAGNGSNLRPYLGFISVLLPSLFPLPSESAVISYSLKNLSSFTLFGPLRSFEAACAAPPPSDV